MRNCVVALATFGLLTAGSPLLAGPRAHMDLELGPSFFLTDLPRPDSGFFVQRTDAFYTAFHGGIRLGVPWIELTDEWYLEFRFAIRIGSIFMQESCTGDSCQRGDVDPLILILTGRTSLAIGYQPTGSGLRFYAGVGTGIMVVPPRTGEEAEPPVKFDAQFILPVRSSIGMCIDLSDRAFLALEPAAFNIEIPMTESWRRDVGVQVSYELVLIAGISI